MRFEVPSSDRAPSQLLLCHRLSFPIVPPACRDLRLELDSLRAAASAAASKLTGCALTYRAVALTLMFFALT